MGVKDFPEGRRRKRRTYRKDEVESVFIRWAAMKTHLGIQGQAFMLLSMARVGLNELVVEENSWLGCEIKE